METQSSGWTLGELASILNGALDGLADVRITRPVAAGDDDSTGITFAENEAFLSKVEASQVGAVLISENERATAKPAIRVPSPRMAFGRLLAMSVKDLPIEKGADPAAVISDQATVSDAAFIGAYAVVERGAKVAKGARIYPFAYIGEDCDIGEDAVVYPHATLYRDVTLGSRTIVHSGAVLGADGFGFIWDGKTRIKVPQVGRVTIGDDVEIGANTTIDRATAGATRVGNGTKLDNLIQVGHNCEIGEQTVIAGMCGISGSTTIGDRVVMGGGVGTKDHVTIGNDVILGGRSGVDGDILEPGAYFGTPARPIKSAMRAFALLPKLPDLLDRIRQLEKEVKELRGEKS